mgnify:CR=1 FL=1
MGTILRVNNAFGVPAPNINDDTKFIELYNQRTSSNTAGTGELVGQARCYSFAVSDASYTGDSTEWDLHLFDIQTFTRLVINNAVSNTELPNASYVRGVSSGATGYANGSAGTNGRGNGASGATSSHPNEGQGAAGGSGIVIVRYVFS